MNFPIVNRSPGQITFAAVTMGALAMFRAWVVIHPSRHSGLIGSRALIAFEVVKSIALLLILARVYMLNSRENDGAIRSSHVYTFTRLAAVSVVIDTGITLFKL